MDWAEVLIPKILGIWIQVSQSKITQLLISYGGHSELLNDSFDHGRPHQPLPASLCFRTDQFHFWEICLIAGGV